MRFDKLATTIVAAATGFIVAKLPQLGPIATPEIQVAIAGAVAGLLNWGLSLLLNKFPSLKSLLSLGQA